MNRVFRNLDQTFVMNQPLQVFLCTFFIRRFVLHNFVILVQNCSYCREIVGNKLEAKSDEEISTPSHAKPQVVNLNKNQSERNIKSTGKVPEHD